MTDIKAEYYSGAEWVELTDYLTAFHVNDENVSRVPSASVVLEGLRTDFTDYIASPFKLFRIQIKPSDTWQTIFFGMVNEPEMKTFPGIPLAQSRVALNLGCVSALARLARDYITFDYYAYQSAIQPYEAASYTFRDVIEDFLANPDSQSNTGFALDAAEDASGIDHAVDATCTFNRQTLLDAVRTICDRIGYDGYFTADLEDTPTIHLSAFDKASAATIGDPFIGEPLYNWGNLMDVYNHVLATGGVDVGIPSDCDRWTEYAAAKFDPAIWFAARSGASTTITDVDNTVFSENLRVGDKCVKFSTTGSTSRNLIITLNIENCVDWTSIDAKNRIMQLAFSIKLFTDSSDMGRYNRFYLYDSVGNIIGYTPADGALVTEDFEMQYKLVIGEGTSIASYSTSSPTNQWYYCEEATTFDWEHIVGFVIETESHNLSPGLATVTWGLYIDGLQFVGGMNIDPDVLGTNPSGLNPAVTDATSISTYGLGVMHYQNSQLTSFEQAQVEATRLVTNLKNPIPTLTVTKANPTATQLYPSDVVTVDSIDRRIASMQYVWSRKSPSNVNVTYKLLAKTAVLPPIWTVDHELKRLIK